MDQKVTSPKKMGLLITALSCVLGACGGGEAPESSGIVTQKLAEQASEISSAANGASSGSADVYAAKHIVGVQTTTVESVSGAVTSVKAENPAAVAQSNVPFTFGQVFAPGHVAATDYLVGKLSDGTQVPFQVDIKAKHPDGSIRHAVISAVLPKLAAGETQTIYLAKGGAAPAQPSNSPAALLGAGFTASVNIVIGGELYTASADALLKAGKYTSWLAGPVAHEWLVSAPFKNALGREHPHLSARFAIRSYDGLNKAKVDVTLENDWAYEPNPQNFIYDAQVFVGGQSRYSKTGLNHFHHARWRKTFWWGAEPQLHVRHDSAYLLASKAVPNYDRSIVVTSAGISSLNSRWLASVRDPMGPGLVLPYMPNTGGRPDIGPVPQWAAMYLLSMDRTSKDVTLGIGDLAGSWPIHYRDKKTDLPVSLVDYPAMTILGSASDAIDPVTRVNEAFPVCGGICSTSPYNYSPDSSHQPSLAYVPYLVTGDYFYLEELQFWADWNMFRSNPYYRDFGKGLMKWDQVRGQAWSMRTLAHAAYITPDNHPMKRYFVDRVGYNVDWYNTTYTNANPNQLGVIDGSGANAFPPMLYTTPSGEKTGLAPWQDDFFTWSAGHLAELGFTNAQPLLAWKAKFPIGRMTASGYCWIDGAPYALSVRASASSPLYTTFKDAYLATMRRADGSPMINSTGARYLDQPCGSQAQADWRTRNDLDNKVSRTPWLAGEMDGYASSPSGYPANMQPALAVAATSGNPNGATAWGIFMKRSVKPDYSVEPQWAVVPRQ